MNVVDVDGLLIVGLHQLVDHYVYLAAVLGVLRAETLHHFHQFGDLLRVHIARDSAG